MSLRLPLRCLLVLALAPAVSSRQADGTPALARAVEQARANADFAQEGFRRCARYLDGWLAHADPETGLVPRNLGKDRDVWEPKDSAADNFPFLLLSARLLAPATYERRVLPMLATETRLTSRVGALPDAWSFSRDAFVAAEPDLRAVVYGASEYAKDGLLAITELLGPGPWSERMDALTRDVLANGRFEAAVGTLPLDSYEVNGEMLQVLCRSYWRTGDAAFLAAALRIGDHYLLGEAVPTRVPRRLRLRDHGCELVAGLGELYLTASEAAPERARLYRPVLHEVFDRVLAVARNADGLFYDEVDLQTGGHVEGLADTFGYVLDGLYTVHLVDERPAYRDAVRQVLAALPAGYRGFRWEGDSADGLADALEGALGLHRFEPSPALVPWLEDEARTMWAKQREDGTIEGWHGDGNFARTSLMLALWRTQGVRAEPWRPDLALGAVAHADGLVLVVRAEETWEGRLAFDVPRHRVLLGLPRDHPRTNAFPEWYTVEADRAYRVLDLATGARRTLPGGRLAAGLSVRIEAGAERAFRID